MKLPHADRAVVEVSKIRDYLLAAANPRARGKPAFFLSLGFGVEQGELLRRELLQIAQSDSAKEGQASIFGQKFEIRATLKGPSGKTAQVNTVWIIETGTSIPRFVTAYPS